jgi:ABC-type Mn2+/Zn2+ transport system ATPase subunit
VTRQEGLRLAYVPQVETVDWNFPVTVGEVVGMSRPQRLMRPKAARSELSLIEDVLERLGLGGLLQRHIRELSGGQQQRVFLARALIQKPDMLILDEPTAGVDVRTRHEVLHVLADLNESPPHGDGIAIVLTTHDLNGLASHLPRLVCFNRTVIADGSPAEVLQPYFLERTYGAPMEVLQHGGMPIVLEQGGDVAVIDPGSYTRPLTGLSNVRAVVMTHMHDDHCFEEQLDRIVAENTNALLFGTDDVRKRLAESRPQLAVTSVHHGDYHVVGN